MTSEKRVGLIEDIIFHKLESIDAPKFICCRPFSHSLAITLVENGVIFASEIFASEAAKVLKEKEKMDLQAAAIENVVGSLNTMQQSIMKNFLRGCK